MARGFQYAEAIRVFHLRHQRFPNQLSELVENPPRSIRKLWDDPMTGTPFLLLMEGPGGAVVPVDPLTGEMVAPQSGDTPDEKEGEGPAAAPAPKLSPGGQGGALVAGPIHGVKSRGHGEAYRVLFDQKDYGSWEFSVERLVAATSANAPDGTLRRLDYTTIGKPFPYPPPGGVAGGNPQPLKGGQPGAPPPGQNQPNQQPQGDPVDDGSEEE